MVQSERDFFEISAKGPRQSNVGSAFSRPAPFGTDQYFGPFHIHQMAARPFVGPQKCLSRTGAWGPERLLHDAQ